MIVSSRATKSSFSGDQVTLHGRPGHASRATRSRFAGDQVTFHGPPGHASRATRSRLWGDQVTLLGRTGHASRANRSRFSGEQVTLYERPRHASSGGFVWNSWKDWETVSTSVVLVPPQKGPLDHGLFFGLFESQSIPDVRNGAMLH